MPDNHQQVRYFFAVWPDATVRDHLFEWSQAVRADDSARRVAADNLHITLVFLGALEAPQLEAVCKVADGVEWPRACLPLDRIGYWKRSRIVWAGSRRGSKALALLAETLRDRLRRVGFGVGDRPFVPHVTLYRKARHRPKWTPRSVPWRIEEFCLVRSHLSSNGARYEVLDRWSAMGDVK